MNKIFAEKLSSGEVVSFRPRGNSMNPRIKSGELVTVTPGLEVVVGDIVFCKVRGNYYIHLVKAIDGSRYLIGNNHGKTNGWTRNIFGKVTEIVP